MTIGIYKIYNKENNNTYIGQSKNIEKRFKTHIEDLRNNKHHQYNLQKEYNKIKKFLKKEYKNNKLSNYIDYDKMVVGEYYDICVLEEFDSYDKSKILELEDVYILEYRALQEGYSQKTNKEITQLLKEKDAYKEFISKKSETKEVQDAFEELKQNHLNGKITFNEMTKMMLDLMNSYRKEFEEINNI